MTDKIRAHEMITTTQKENSLRDEAFTVVLEQNSSERGRIFGQSENALRNFSMTSKRNRQMVNEYSKVVGIKLNFAEQNFFYASMEKSWHEMARLYDVPETNKHAYGMFFYKPGRISAYADDMEEFYDWLYEKRKEEGTLTEEDKEKGEWVERRTLALKWYLSKDEVSQGCQVYANNYIRLLFSDFEGEDHILGNLKIVGGRRSGGSKCPTLEYDLRLEQERREIERIKKDEISYGKCPKKEGWQRSEWLNYDDVAAREAEKEAREQEIVDGVKAYARAFTELFELFVGESYESYQENDNYSNALLEKNVQIAIKTAVKKFIEDDESWIERQKEYAKWAVEPVERQPQE